MLTFNLTVTVERMEYPSLSVALFQILTQLSVTGTAVAPPQFGWLFC